MQIGIFIKVFFMMNFVTFYHIKFWKKIQECWCINGNCL